MLFVSGLCRIDTLKYMPQSNNFYEKWHPVYYKPIRKNNPTDYQAL
jgi:hypothetical protein